MDALKAWTVVKSPARSRQNSDTTGGEEEDKHNTVSVFGELMG